MAPDYRDRPVNLVSEPGWCDWLDSPAGRYLLAWEQAQCDRLVDDVFGFYALQCGMPALDGLRHSRISRRILAWRPGDGEPRSDSPVNFEGGPRDEARIAGVRIDQFMELPFGDQTLDLLVLPHVLEFERAPHQVLREADRVLRPDGRLVVIGLNPVSLWGARELLPTRLARAFLPRHEQLITLPRLRDWLELLSFEAVSLAHGCYRPACRTQAALDRSAFLERAGDRWWPICGAVYALAAIKRVRGLRLVGKLRRSLAASAPATVAGTRRGAHADRSCRPRGTAER
jgi:SAM-dependent methyltransferase